MRVLVCGGRDYADRERVFGLLDGLRPTHVIQGNATGADALALEWQIARGVSGEAYTAQWDRYGKAAGAIRNTEMLRTALPDLVVAFPGGRGTANMVEQARRAGVPVLVLEDTGSHM